VKRTYLAKVEPWPDKDGPFRLGLYFAEVNGRMELVGLELWSAGRGATALGEMEPGSAADTLRPEPTHAITAEIARALTPGTLAASALRDLLSFESELVEFPLLSPDAAQRSRAQTASVMPALRAATGERGRHLDAAHYRAVADVYNAAVAAKQSPNVAIAEKWGVDRYTAVRWVQAARHRHGFLSQTQQGSASPPPPRKRGKPSDAGPRELTYRRKKDGTFVLVKERATTAQTAAQTSKKTTNTKGRKS
jgi:hypothetical protein